MKYLLFIVLFSLLSLSVYADLLECEDDKKIPTLADLGIGPKIASDENVSKEHEVRDFFKDLGCKLKKGASKVKEQAKKLGVEITEGAKAFGEKAKDFGSDVKTKFYDFKERLAHDSAEEMTAPPRRILANVEIINPDILKAEQQCGHGHILDALGNCSKLRK